MSTLDIINKYQAAIHDFDIAYKMSDDMNMKLKTSGEVCIVDKTGHGITGKAMLLALTMALPDSKLSTWQWGWTVNVDMPKINKDSIDCDLSNKDVIEVSTHQELFIRATCLNALNLSYISEFASESGHSCIIGIRDVCACAVDNPVALVDCELTEEEYKKYIESDANVPERIDDRIDDIDGVESTWRQTEEALGIHVIAHSSMI